MIYIAATAACSIVPLQTKPENGPWPTFVLCHTQGPSLSALYIWNVSWRGARRRTLPATFSSSSTSQPTPGFSKRPLLLFVTGPYCYSSSIAAGVTHLTWTEGRQAQPGFVLCRMPDPSLSALYGTRVSCSPQGLARQLFEI